MAIVAAFKVRDASAHGSEPSVANETLDRDADDDVALAACTARVATDPLFAARIFSAVIRAEQAPASRKGRRTPLDSNLPAPGSPSARVPKLQLSEPTPSKPTDALADSIRVQATGAGLKLYRISRTFTAPTLEAARARLQAAAQSVLALGTARGFIGAVDRRREPDKAGRDAHMYMVFTAADGAEAETVKLAALGPLRGDRKGEFFDQVPATQTDVRGSVGYCLKRWPLAAGERDPDLDIAASGAFADLWGAHRALVLKAGKVKACGHCGAELRADYAQRKTRLGQDGLPVAGYCSNACKHRAFRRAKKASATQATMGPPRLVLVKAAPEPAPTKPAETQAPMGQASRAVPLDPVSHAAGQAVERLGPDASHLDLEHETRALLALDFEPVPTDLALRRAVRNAVATAPITPTAEAAE